MSCDRSLSHDLENLSKWENRLTYRVFEFVNAELDTSLMKLVCRVILCDARLAQSECRSTCGLK